MQTRDELGSPDEVPPEGVSPAAAAERWNRVKSVFLEALELPAAARREFVTGACAEEGMIANEVLSLLASEQAAAHFAEEPAAAILRPGTSANSASPHFEPGTRLGAYELTGFVSAGGMGEVYRARHSVLGREVAIKTLNAQVSDPGAKRRLVREARHAATLQHPNVCTVHEIGEVGDTPFIVMEFVDGRPLSELVGAAPLRLEDALAYGMQIADALEHAHQNGIVHRDLKSSNVVVDRAGRPVVLDFGLAKLVLRDAPTAAYLSSTTIDGALAGTLSHMAPEVLSGEQADARSDVWSLGVLLYELTTGTLPFEGRTAFETSSAILNEPPRPIPRRVPLALRLVIERCLVKDPGARYQRAAQVRDALDAIRRRRAWPLLGRLLISTRRRTLYALPVATALMIASLIGGPYLLERFDPLAGTRIATLALLPLENATGDPTTDYYAEGLTDGIIAELGRLGDVRVISRGSAARAVASGTTLAEGARLLGVDVIVEGRLRRASDRIALDLRLIEPSRARVLWSDSYERSASQVLALQADVVRALASEIRLTLRPGAREQLAAVRAVNPAAYEEYLKGRFEYNKRTQESLQRAIDHFTRATELDPSYAPPYAALADCYNQSGTVMVGTGSPREFRPLAAAAAIQALQIDRYSAQAHASLGYVRHYDWQFEEAERAFKRAIELNPSYSLARVWYANLLMSLHRFDEALEQTYAAREIDPFSLIVNTNVGWVLIAAGRAEQAIAQLRYALELDSTYVQARWRLSDALRAAGRYQEAYTEALRVVEFSGRASATLGLLAHASAAVGRTDEVPAILAEALEHARHGYVPPAMIAGVFLLLGDVDSALAWVERAFEERANWVVYLPLDPAAGPLQRDPRFQALVARSGLL
jgi:eukaryotic-like serine/threonine-protein kinase